VPVQTLEVERARSDAEHPDLDGRRRHARRTSDARQRRPVDACLDRLGNRGKDHIDAGDLSWQRLLRQHALAMPTTTTTRERHLEEHRPFSRVEPPLDTAPREPKVAASTRSTATADKQLVARNFDDRYIPGTLDAEYENHRAHDGSGGAT
jgi:hypothetical protein